MLLETFISELWAYAHTNEYREGLFIEASGLVLDILLLIVGVKLVAYYLARQTRSTTDFASSFFITQFLHEVLVLQLKTGGINDINASLRVAFEKQEIATLFSHVFYGNIDNILDLLRMRMRTGEHIAGHRSLSIENRLALAIDARSLLGRLDNLLVLLASLRQENLCLRAYKFRLLLTAVTDYLEDLAMSSAEPPPRTYAPMSTGLASATAAWFSTCRKILERQRKSQLRRSYARFLLTLPWVLSYRVVMRRWRRFTGHPYKDPFGSNFASLFCLSLAQALDSVWDKTIADSGIEKEKIHLMQNQHVEFSQEQCIEILKQLRPFVPPSLWNSMLAATLIADTDGRQISLVTADAAKANALYYLKMLATKNDATNHVIEQAFQSLWNLRPSPM